MNKTDKRNAPLYVESVEAAGGGSKMIVMSPKSFEDIQALITNLAGGQSVIFYQVDLELTDLQSHKKLWMGDKKIKKFISKDSVKL